MGKTRDLFKKTRDTKGIFHAKMGTIKDRKTVQKDLQKPYNHDGVITHLEPDILKWKVKWALGGITMNKASGHDGITGELFQILKDDAVKVLHSICHQIWKTQQWPQDWKRSVFIPIPKKGNAKECSSYHTIGLISHTSKVILKILQARLQQYVNFQMFKLGLERQGNQRSNCQRLLDHGKTPEFQKNTYFFFIDYGKAFDFWITTNYGKFLKRWE